MIKCPLLLIFQPILAIVPFQFAQLQKIEMGSIISL